MSSTQHQLIEQCATRLRGIVEALDNIHDTSPHRWSTDLDDVHSSAESLLALIKDQAPARSEASFEEWLANELEGEDGQPVPAAVCDIALARRAFNHWPKLEQPAKVGGVRFSAGVSSRLVVEAAQRLYEFESTPEKEAERIERLQAFREQCFEPLGTEFSKVLSENLVELSSDAKPEQAEAERPEVVAWQYRVTAGSQTGWSLWHHGKGEEFERSYTVERRPLMTVAQHERIVGALRYKAEMYDEVWALVTGKGYMNVTTAISVLESERAAALARVAEMERQEPVAWMHDQPNRVDVIHRDVKDLLQRVPGSSRGIHRPLDVSEHYTIPLYAAPVAQAQHSVPEEFSFEYRHPNGESHTVTVSRDQVINEMPDFLFEALCSKFCNCEPAGETNVVECCCDEYAEEFKLLAAAPGNSVPQAWLDVQAERRRQVTAEGWTPEHDDAHSHGQMARAAACYALAGSSAPNDGTAALLVSLAWPWDEQWWKPSTARRDLVKACALALAEIERLDRAGISQSPQPGATTASS
ncbi:TPA: hypothetical protein ACIDZ6_000692 [Pseudomonas aeruginosa]